MSEILTVYNLLELPEASIDRLRGIKGLNKDIRAHWANILQADLTSTLSVTSPDHHDARMRKIRLMFKLRGEL